MMFVFSHLENVTYFVIFRAREAEKKWEMVLCYVCVFFFLLASLHNMSLCSNGFGFGKKKKKTSRKVAGGNEWLSFQWQMASAKFKQEGATNQLRMSVIPERR